MNNRGYVYIITEGEGRYKIGYTKKSVESRIKSLQTGNPNQLSLVKYHEVYMPSRIETMLHNYYKDCLVKGEWYDLSSDQIEEFGAICDRFQLVNYSLKDNPFW